MLPRTVCCYGREDPLPERLNLQAGPLSMVFEPQQGFLRYVRMGNCEVLRGVYVAVRDRNWGTVAPQMNHLSVTQTQDTFLVTFDVTCREREIDFFWKGRLSGDADGTVAYSMDGEARSTFRRNRIGFCVLHPIPECAGRSCRVEKADGTAEQGAFPDAISPHQPFLDMRAISHEVTPGVWAEVRFEGDIFEMEDQRNWTDASYKTYCTPLVLPFPVEVTQGTAVFQSVTLKLPGELPRRTAGTSVQKRDVLIEATDQAAVPLPDVGLGLASHGTPLSGTEIERLRALNLAHLRVDLKLFEPEWMGMLERTAAEAEELGFPLEAALFLSDAAEDELGALSGALDRIRPRAVRWLIYHASENSTTAPWVTLARRFLKRYDPGAVIGAGTNAYFTELNRERPPTDALDFVCYSLNPQVHAFDNASLVETLEAQAWTVASARRFAGGLPIVVTPVTLRPRFNPNATGPEPAPAPGELPSQVDVRQMSLLGAGWTLGSLKYLSQSQVGSVTYYETSGWRGVMETANGSPVPERFRSIPGGVFPLYHVLADYGAFAGGEIVPCRSSAALRADGMVLKQDGRIRILVTNLIPEPQVVRVACPELSGDVLVRVMDETNAEEAMLAPEAFRQAAGERRTAGNGMLSLDLGPCAVAYVDWVRL